jgi:SAM-dependent methyltransferase
MSNWFDRAFGPWYLKLYPHRDRAEAERAWLVLGPRLAAGASVLDVGCGPGRYLEVLRERGFRAVGLDRSADLLREAARAGAAPGRLARGDMRRLPFRGEVFDAVLSMFTSFGYFETRAEHRTLLAEFARVTGPGGIFVLDTLNAPAVRETLVPASRRLVEGHEVIETRSVESGHDADRVVKELVILDPRGGELERYQERVALYDREEVSDMLGASGWTVREVLGDYAGGPWSVRSPRLILVAQRSAR